MAGSGKTTLLQRLQLHLTKAKQPPFIINLDPAVAHVPYFPNIDIRDTVGPLGLIFTLLRCHCSSFMVFWLDFLMK